MKRYSGSIVFLTIMGLGFFHKTEAQYKIGGQVFSTSKESIAGATISLLNPKDSSAKQTILSDSLGKFYFNHVGEGTWLVRISALNYTEAYKKVRFSPAHEIIMLDSVMLTSNYQSMGDVSIVIHRAVMKVKNDTAEFNASSSGSGRMEIRKTCLKRSQDWKSIKQVMLLPREKRSPRYM